jgi:hypothetical protein
LDCAHCSDTKEIALELVEVPVRCTVEIGRNGVPDRFAAILGNNSRHLVQHQRGAICRPEHDTRKTSPAIDNRDC